MVILRCLKKLLCERATLKSLSSEPFYLKYSSLEDNPELAQFIRDTIEHKENC